MLTQAGRRLARLPRAGRRRPALHLRGRGEAPAFLRLARRRDLAAGAPDAAGRARRLPAQRARRPCATSSAASTTAGFLTASPADIALMSGLPLEDVQAAQKLLQTLDPPGIGAQSLAECLLFQLEAKGRGTSLAARIIRDHFELLTRRRIPDLARRLGRLGRRDPCGPRRDRHARPGARTPLCRGQQPRGRARRDRREGRTTSGRSTSTATTFPRLRISQTYRDLIAKGQLSKDERDYLRERMRSGRFLINSIEQRQQTIERITREIIKVQEEFFEHGVSQAEAAHDDADRRRGRRARDDRQPGHREQVHPDPARRLRHEVFLHARLPGAGRRLRLQHDRQGDDQRPRSPARTAPIR